MSLLDLKIYPDPILRMKCESVNVFTDEECNLLNHMLFTMKHYNGIGLAAPQVGIAKRLIVADVGEGPVQLVDPEVVKTSGEDIMVEGCLSLPETIVEVKRPFEVTVTGINAKGEEVEIKTDGLLGRVILHEIDHLNGKLIIDYLDVMEQIKYHMGKYKM